MSTLEEIQNKFQQSILKQDGSILEDIIDTSKEDRSVLLYVYQHAYGARLTEVLENDYPKTATYLGEESFKQFAQDYYAAHPSNTPNARWFGRFFAPFLTTHKGLAQNPECYELAALEHALGTAFDAKDIPPLNLSNLTSLAPEEWALLTFKSHPSTTRLSHKTNASEIWTALNKDKQPETAKQLENVNELICWRGENMARFRTMNYDEVMIWDEAQKGANFSQLCEMLGTYWPEEEAPLKAAGYLQAWLSSEFLIQPDN